MAASINGYPHIEMHVRDDSIYIPRSEEILPLSKPLYMMKTARGPVGVPVWCPTYTDAVRVFGADTFNKRSRYFSENAYFLLKTFPFNGAFIMRVTSETAKNAKIAIEVGLSKTSIYKDANGNEVSEGTPGDKYRAFETPCVPQYKRDTNGNFVLEFNGAKIPINDKGQTEAEYYASAEEGEDLQPFEQAMLPGYRVAWRVVYDVGDGENNRRPYGSEMTTDTDGGQFGGYTWYPMLDIMAANPGVWGHAYGIKLFFDPTINTLSGIITNGSTTVTLSPVEFLQDATQATPITDSYGQTAVTGVMKPDVIDADTEVDLTLGKRVARAYAGAQALPLKFFYIPENWNTVGKELMLAEIAVREAAHEIYPDLPYIVTDATVDEHGDPITLLGVQTFVDDLFQVKKTVSHETGEITGGDEIVGVKDIIDDAGYMANPLSCVNYNGIPYFGSIIVDATDDTIIDENGDGYGKTVDPESGEISYSSGVNPKSIIVPSSDQCVFLAAGWDGGEAGIPFDWEVEEYIRYQIRATIAQNQDYLNDYWHCPFNVVYDTGYSLKTKKAIIDMTAVRDNMVAVISSQITWKKDATDVQDPVANSRMDDEAIAASLRAYALLMKEDVENATGACRTVIFTAAGKTSDHDDKWLPFTLWYALKNAEYLNKQYIDQEPKELPYSSVECFTEWSWTAAQEDTKSRIWNSGVNYVQHYDMTGIHFASVRSVYWYETSILVDAGVVNALCFMKDIARRSWSTWAGSTRKAAELNKKITEDLDSRLAYMLHDKFRHKVNVYQTEEDMNLGFQRHVDLELWAAGQNRVWKTTIICKREGYNDRIDNA